MAKSFPLPVVGNEDLVFATGRRRIRVFREKGHPVSPFNPDKVYLEILLGKEHLATLELDVAEVDKLIAMLIKERSAT